MGRRSTPAAAGTQISREGAVPSAECGMRSVPNPECGVKEHSALRIPHSALEGEGSLFLTLHS